MKLRWGIIGLGKIAGHFANDFRLGNQQENEITAVASRNMDKARAFAQKHGIERYYGSYQDLFLDPEIDIIYIATPHNSHRDHTMAALKAGKNVLCEKPMGVSASEVQEMIATAQSENRFLMEALWTRWNPILLKTIEVINSDQLGKISKVEADFGFEANMDASSRLFNPRLAGGALLDIGIYPLFLSYLILGLPNSIRSKATFAETGVDAETEIVLEYNEGAIGIARCSLLQTTETIARIQGSEGEIIISSRWHEADEMTIRVNGIEQTLQLDLANKGYLTEALHCNEMLSMGLVESNMWSWTDSENLATLMDTVRAQIGLKYPFE